MKGIFLIAIIAIAALSCNSEEDSTSLQPTQSIIGTWQIVEHWHNDTLMTDYPQGNINEKWRFEIDGKMFSIISGNTNKFLYEVIDSALFLTAIDTEHAGTTWEYEIIELNQNVLHTAYEEEDKDTHRAVFKKIL